MDGMFGSCGVDQLNLNNFNASKVSKDNIRTMFDGYNGNLVAKDAKILKAYEEREPDEELDISSYC